MQQDISILALQIPSMRPQQQSFKKGGYKKHAPTPGSTLPRSMQEELDEQETDDRKFGKKFTIKASTRKELRKQKKVEKGKRNAERHQRKRPLEEPVKANNHNNKRQKTTTTETQIKKQPQTKDNTKVDKPIAAKKTKSSAEAMKRLEKSNPGLYKMLQSDNLIHNETGKVIADNGDFEQDDRDIAYWEKKLGLNKKKDKSLGKEFEEDGLLEVLGNIEGEEGENDDDLEYLRKKRQRQNDEKNKILMEEKAEEAMDDMFAGFESDEDDDDEADDQDMEMDGLLNESDSEDDEEAELIEEDDVDSDEMALKEDDEEESDQEDDEAIEPPKATEHPKSSVLTKYVPPHLRKAPAGKSEMQIKLHKQLMGQLNRLSESNMESILLEIEKCYGTYPRHDVTATLTDIILTSISQKSNLLDSFVITYATIVASLYRLIGIEFAAHLVQTLVELFEKEYKKCKASIQRGDDNGDQGPEGSRESKNLLTLILELYNFQVLSCIIIYDIVRMLIENLDENSVELLLRIIRTAGPEMRSDDPTSLKHIIDEIQKETSKRDPATISTRHKFMLETIANVKNNKIKNNQTAGGHGDKEMVSKMKKFLNGLSKKRTVRSTEALRVSLDDIRNVETKGKWWLVGASWKDNLVGTSSKYSTTKMPEDLKKDQSLQEALLKLARKQGMNTDIRRTIFVTIMSSEDYLDAFEKLMKLGLTEVQQREICRVMLQCTGNEKTFNPYYMLVSKRLCEVDHSFKVTFQYCLWDFLRECGESEVGGLERSATENSVLDEGNKNIRVSKLSNMAKFYASLIADGALTLAVLKSVNFMSVQRNARIFLEILFANLLLQLHSGGAQAIANVFAKILELRTLAQGCQFFMLDTVVHGRHTGLGQAELDKVQWSCKIAREVLGAK
ncbi:mif4g ma4 domain-containing protein [Mucor ambiguus]|uniref:Mif4g ma4 domain-containing protein n=1 Tax=Mucor ambiguus TaxID=91626 RepID=A0A0C9ME15_9FUNG|nr:mif4g ma4 domain-containing protein [Mucor ambiguus]